jgi:hypothetical protein
LHNATSVASFRCEAGPATTIATSRTSLGHVIGRISHLHAATLRQCRDSLQDTPFNRKRRDSAGDDASLGGHVTDLRITENDDGAGQLAPSHQHRPAQANGPSHAYAGSG